MHLNELRGPTEVRAFERARLERLEASRVFAEVERSLIAERVRAGLRNARKKGKRVGTVLRAAQKSR